jgi:hypothetical protein
MRGRLVDATASDAVLDDKPSEKTTMDGQPPASYAQPRLADMDSARNCAAWSSIPGRANWVEAAVVDLLKRERPGCRLMPVNTTGGASETRNGGYYGFPKRDLVTGVQVLLKSGGLQIASGMPHAAVLVVEMAEMRAEVTAAGLRTGIYEPRMDTDGHGLNGGIPRVEGTYGHRGPRRRNPLAEAR